MFLVLRKEVKICQLELKEWVGWYQSIDQGRLINHIYERDLPKLQQKSKSE